VSCFGVAEAFVADVGDAVALGVGASGAGLPGDVDAKGVGRAEAGALADEQNGELCAEDEADLIADGYAGLGDDAGWAEAILLRVECEEHGVE